MMRGGVSIKRIPLALIMFGVLSWAIVRVNLPLGMAATGRALAAWRSFPGSAEAASLAARDLLIAGRPGAGAPARFALATAPIDQRALSTLAIAEGGPRLIERMQLSAALGWRDQLTQLWLAEAALESNQSDLFAQRIVAIARQTGDLSILTPILDYAITRPAIRTALLPYLRERSRWRQGYLGSDPHNRAAAQVRVQLLDKMFVAKIVVPASEVAQIVRYLVHYNLLGDAYAVWRAHLYRPQFAGLLYDGAFANIGIDGEAPPFQWVTPANLPGYVVREGNTLHIQQDRASGTPLLRQSLPLNVGRYRLQWHVVGDPATGAPASEMPFRWQIDCAGLALIDTDQVPRLITPGWFAIDVNVTAPCPRADLTLGSRVDIDGSARRETYIKQAGLF